MLNEVNATLANLDCIPKRLLSVISGYVFCLTLIMKRHSFRAASDVVGLHESRFSALLNDEKTPQLSREILNRATRRRLSRIKGVQGRLVFIVDSTLKGRKSRRVENVRKHHNGSGFSLGHKFVNFVLVDGEQIIPLQSLPTYTRKYCRENGMKYRSEIKIVKDWILGLGDLDLFSENQLRSAIFLLDSGFDAKAIQNAVLEIGANFVMSLKSNRVIEGLKVKELFRSYRRWLPWQKIRTLIGKAERESRRQYSIRTATGVNLKGVGPITVVCSKALSRAKKPIKYLASSDLSLTGKEIVIRYALRWKIELWHREIKQNYGFGDCFSSRFSAIESHVNLCMVAYLVQQELGCQQMKVEEFSRINELRMIKREIGKFGATRRLKTLIDAALQKVAA